MLMMLVMIGLLCYDVFKSITKACRKKKDDNNVKKLDDSSILVKAEENKKVSVKSKD